MADSESETIRLPTLVGLLLFRGLVFLAVQGLIAAIVALQGGVNPWFVAGNWWMIAGTVANTATIWLLVLRARREGRPLREVFSPRGRQNGSRSNRRAPLVTHAGAALAGAALLAAGAVGFARLFMGGFLSARMILLQPLPLWAAVLGGLGFPLTLALAEVPWYYGYLYPRLRNRGLPAILALFLLALVHAGQYAGLPFLPAVPYVLYRSLSFLPFALGVALWSTRSRVVLPVHMVVLAAGNAWAGYQLIRLSLGG